MPGMHHDTEAIIWVPLEERLVPKMMHFFALGNIPQQCQILEDVGSSRRRPGRKGAILEPKQL